VSRRLESFYAPTSVVVLSPALRYRRSHSRDSSFARARDISRAPPRYVVIVRCRRVDAVSHRPRSMSLARRSISFAFRSKSLAHRSPVGCISHGFRSDFTRISFGFHSHVIRISFGFHSDFIRISFGFQSDFSRISFAFHTDFIRISHGFQSHVPPPSTDVDVDVVLHRPITRGRPVESSLVVDQSIVRRRHLATTRARGLEGERACG